MDPPPAPVFQACKHGTVREVVSLLKMLKNINYPDPVRHQSPLHWTCIGGNLPVAEFLLFHGADIEYRSENYNTPLLTAIASHQVDMVRFLLQRGASVNVFNDDGLSPLRYACNQSSPKMVRLLLRAKDIDVNQLHPRTRATALHGVCEEGQLDLVDILLRHPGVDVDRANLRETPLWRACKLRREDVAIRLLQCGADASLVPPRAKYTPFTRACALGMDRAVRQFMQAPGFEVDQQDSKGYTGLHRAALAGNELVVRLLLRETPANANVPSQCGLMTPLLTACRHGYNEIAHMLLDSGWADVCAADGSSGLTSLHWASERMDISLTGRLLAWGADVNACSLGGLTPLHMACMHGRPAAEGRQWRHRPRPARHGRPRPRC